MANDPDKAFFYLKKAVIDKNEFNVSDTDLLSDDDLTNLHHDKRWEPLLGTLKENKKKKEANLNRPLVLILDTVFADDQDYRHKFDSISKQPGWQSSETDKLMELIKTRDSINLLKIRNILANYGWPGPDIIGDRGSTTLFLVIQHADLQTQQTYLPALKEAVKNGKAKASSLAYLEDRILVRQGKKQVYGSQITRDEKTGKYSIDPIEDELKVDKRRTSVGLERLEEYVKQWGIIYKLPKTKK